MRNQQKQEASLQISNEGMEALKKMSEEKEKKALESKANAIAQQISMLSMQLIQVQKANSDSNTI